MITSEYREALEQFTLRYNELTGILRERKEKEQKTDQKKVQLQVQKQEIVALKEKMTVLEKQLELWKEEEAEFNKDMEQTQIFESEEKNSKRGEPLSGLWFSVILYMKKMTVGKKKDRKALT